MSNGARASFTDELKIALGMVGIDIQLSSFGSIAAAAVSARSASRCSSVASRLAAPFSAAAS
jgi:hypothetical protein